MCSRYLGFGVADLCLGYWGSGIYGEAHLAMVAVQCQQLLELVGVPVLEHLVLACGGRGGQAGAQTPGSPQVFELTWGVAMLRGVSD